MQLLSQVLLQHNHKIVNLLKFYGVYGVSWLIYFLSIAFFVEIVGMSSRLSGLITLPITTLFNFFGQKLFVFVEKRR